jgi:hypothetical protein
VGEWGGREGGEGDAISIEERYGGSGMVPKYVRNSYNTKPLGGGLGVGGRGGWGGEGGAEGGGGRAIGVHLGTPFASVTSVCSLKVRGCIESSYSFC